MENTEGFYDLCIPYQKNEKVLREIVKEALNLGYKTIAIEQLYDHSKRDVTKRAADIFPAPAILKQLEDEFQNQVKILKRLTIIYVDVGIAHAMVSKDKCFSFNRLITIHFFVDEFPKPKNVQLNCWSTKTDGALTHCCTSFAGDLVTFDMEAGVKLLVNRKAYQMAIKRGLFFEIKYGPAIKDSYLRKDIIKLAQNYCVRGKSRNIIFSSGATNAFELRGPYDVANLGSGKSAVDKSCRQLFLKAESRRIGKTIMVVRASGPMVFSNISDEEEEMQNYEQKGDDFSTVKDELKSYSDGNSPEQPSKKK